MEAEVVVNFDDIADAFIRANMSGSPAELHGLLCGRVSGGEHLSEDDLVSTVAEFLDAPLERVEDFGDMFNTYSFASSFNEGGIRSFYKQRIVELQLI